MDLLPITLSVKRGKWRIHDDSAIAAEAGFQDVRLRVLERDRHTCRYCGFKAAKWQEINHQDGDHANHADSNLFTACGLWPLPCLPSYGARRLLWRSVDLSAGNDTG